MNNTEVGQRIRAQRKAVKMNQKALSTALQISQPEMSNIEKGKRVLTDARVVQVAAVLGCDAHFLATGETVTAPAQAQA